MNSTLLEAIAGNPEMIHRVFDAVPEPTYLLDKSGTYIDAWGGKNTKCHHNPAVLIGLTQHQVLPLETAEWFCQIIADVVDSGQATELEYSLDPKEIPCFEGIEGPTEPQHFSAFVVPLPNAPFVLWTVRNITEYKLALEYSAHQQAELEKLTYKDHLTQLYNRYALDSLLPAAFDSTKAKDMSSAILMIDIDCFKQFNDYYGHLRGDDALKTVANAILTWATPQDLCFRYGGDEFLIYITGVSKAESYSRAEHLRQAILGLNIPHKGSSVAEQLTITIGMQFCASVTGKENAEQIVAIADKALFYAKNRQRGSIHQLIEQQ